MCFNLQASGKNNFLDFPSLNFLNIHKLHQLQKLRGEKPWSLFQIKKNLFLTWVVCSVPPHSSSDPRWMLSGYSCCHGNRHKTEHHISVNKPTVSNSGETMTAQTSLHSCNRQCRSSGTWRSRSHQPEQNEDKEQCKNVAAISYWGRQRVLSSSVTDHQFLCCNPPKQFTNEWCLQSSENLVTN